MKKIVTGTVIGLALAGLGGLLAGFAPSPSSRLPEMRGRLLSSWDDSRLPLSRPEHDSLRFAGATSGRMSLNRAAVQAPAEVTSPDHSLLRFDGPSVVFLTDDGPRPIYLSGGAMAVLPLLPPGAVREGGFAGDAEGVLFTVPEAAALAEGGQSGADGRPLRWARTLPDHGGPVCARPLILPAPAPLARPALEPGFRSMPMLARAMRYQDTVERYSRKYGLDTPLVLAIMQTESGFNPALISARQAHGLMQVVPDTAGDEVHRWMGRSGAPTPDDLLNPDNNIRYGMAYLHLLQTRHLEGIQNPLSLEYCVIAAYNGGSGAVLRHFGRTKDDAFDAINAMTPDDVLNRLTNDFPARETRFFVRKVLSTRSQFVAHASGAAKNMGSAGNTGAAVAAAPEQTVRHASVSSSGMPEKVPADSEDIRAQLHQLDRRLSALQQAKAASRS